MMDVNGKNVLRLTETVAMEETPVWSPDGMKIAFASGKVFAQSDIFVMHGNGADLVNLTQNPQSRNENPSWSPDGERIVFQA